MKRFVTLISLVAFLVAVGTAASATSTRPVPQLLRGSWYHGASIPDARTNGHRRNLQPAKAHPSKTVSTKERRQVMATAIAKVIREAKPLSLLDAREPHADNAVIQQPNGPRLRIRGKAAAAVAGYRGFAAVSTTPNPNAQVGKLLFDTQPGPGVNWSHCSATAINTENRSFVLTAGHCVYNTDPDGDGIIQAGASRNGYWYENVRFCPGYDGGCKLGVWYARNMFTTNSWFYGTGTQGRYDWSDDVGVVLVSRSATNGYLTDAVGGQGIDFNRATGLYRTAFGYPVSDWRFPSYTYSGESLVYCAGYDRYDGAGHVVIDCTMTGGASGGPWIIGANAAWMGYVNSVNSHKPSAETMGGPYFDTTEANLFQYARNR
jgi:hypothetical protein